MSQKLDRISVTIAFLAFISSSALASPNCLKDQTPFELAGDTVEWTMAAAPGSECIQGLRWPYMQIYGVSMRKLRQKAGLLLSDPDSGIANENQEADSFTLVVLGRNRRDPGKP